MSAQKPGDAVELYARQVGKGKILAGPYVRLACKRHLGDLKRKKELTWNREGAEQAIRFFSTVLVLENGKPFELDLWQKFIVGSCFGWFLPDGRRRFRTAYVEAAKGSGKTPLAAGIGLYGLIADGEPAPEVYAAATTVRQAGIAFKDAVRMVKDEPELTDAIHVQVGSLFNPANGGVFRAVSSEHKGLDGLRVHVGLIDELHEHPNAMVVDKIRAGTKARKNALIFEITNSGWDRTSVCWQHHDFSVKVLEGTIENDSWFAYVCALDDGDSWLDEKVWLKACPGLHTVLPIAYMREQVKEAQGMPSKENIVRRLNFCEWTEQADRWLDMEAWGRCGGKIKEEQFEGLPLHAAFDGASTSDLCAHARLFGPDEDGLYFVQMQFWLPEATLAAQDSGRTEHDRLLLRSWVDQGFIRATSGNTTDYDSIEDEILESLAPYKLREWAYDRWNVNQLVTHIKDSLGETRVVEYPQTMSAMTAPTKELEKLVVSAKLRHGDNPVLRWMASNVAIQFGRNQQCKPDKDRSREKIDGISAIAMALGRSILHLEKPPQDYSVMVLR